MLVFVIFRREKEKAPFFRFSLQDGCCRNPSPAAFVINSKIPQEFLINSSRKTISDIVIACSCLW